MHQNTGLHRVLRSDDQAAARAVEPAFVDDRLAPADHGAVGDAVARRDGARRRLYLSVRTKFALAFTVSIVWTIVSTMLALPWLHDLAGIVSWPVAIFAVGGIAVLPGMMNAFLVTGLLLDKRPQRQKLMDYPAISILVAAYNEESSIADTLKSIAAQNYPGEFEVLVIDDGSKDATAAIVEANPYPWLRLLRQPRNMGKAAALNRGLAESKHDYVITLDADSYMYGDALARLVERYFSDPASTRAVAGTMLVRNSRANWITRAQEWDYFHGISAIKRVQSLFQGTMVAQGAFSIYDRAALRGDRRLAGLRRRGHRAHVGDARARLARRPRRGRLLLHQRPRQPAPVRQAAPALEPRHDGGVPAASAHPGHAAHVDAVRLVERAVPVARPRLHAVLHSRRRSSRSSASTGSRAR